MRTISHEQQLMQFAESVNILLGSIEKKHEELIKDKTDEQTVDFYTAKLIKDWFKNNGGL